jgi:hypothetical protein
MCSENKRVAIFIAFSNADHHIIKWVKHCISNIFTNTHYDHAVYIYNLNSEISIDEREYFTTLNEQFGYKYIHFYETNIYNAFIHFLTNSKEQYKCVVPISHFVSSEWIQELIYQYNKFDDCGVLSIKSQETNCELSVLSCAKNDPNNDTDLVWFSANNFVEGLLFFDDKISSKYLEYVDDGESVGINVSLSILSNLLSKHNFYINQQNLIELKIHNEVLFPNERQIANNITKFANELKIKINKINKNG